MEVNMELFKKLRIVTVATAMVIGVSTGVRCAAAGAPTSSSSAASPSSVSKLQIDQIFNLSSDDLRVDDALAKLPSLEDLDLSQRYLGIEGLRILKKVLQKMSHLKTLNLMHTGLNNHDMVLLEEGLQNSTEIETLNLSKNSFGIPKYIDEDKQIFGVRSLAAALQQMPYLKTLNLAATNLTTAGINILARGLQNSAIETLDLSENSLEDVGVQKLARYLPNMPHLKALNLGYNNLTAGSIDILAPILQNSVIETLVLSGNSLEDVGVQKLAALLPQMPHLKTLNLAATKLTYTDVNILAQGLQNNSAIETLDLSENYFENMGVLRLAEFLPQMPYLKTLNLGYNNLTAGSIDILAPRLQNSVIETLDLSGNYLEDVGVQKLARYLPNMPHLKTLNLMYVRLTAGSLHTLAQGLQNSTVETLDLSGNGLGDAEVQILAKYLPKQVSNPQQDAKDQQSQQRRNPLTREVVGGEFEGTWERDEIFR
jgi:Ran GTPase-activating protein (RanGAP) involved in mRNA processing and transport